MKREKSHYRSGPKRQLAIITISLLILLVLAGLIYWQRAAILSWIELTTREVFQLFGWGLLLVTIVIFIIVEVSLTKPVLFLRYWNKWIGGLILMSAIWGILSLFFDNGLLKEHSLGGSIGLSIIGPYTFAGILSF
jgi:hypothetical protein